MLGAIAQFERELIRERMLVPLQQQCKFLPAHLGEADVGGPMKLNPGD
jgi:hypothetical protein